MALLTTSMDLDLTSSGTTIDPFVHSLTTDAFGCYTSLLAGYTTCLENEYGAFNLLESISTNFIETENYTHPIKTIRIRRMENDELFPYDASIFIPWYDNSPTDPVTREDLSYIEGRVQLKKECLLYCDQDFLHRTFGSTVLQSKLFKELMRVGCLQHYASNYVLPLRVCIDPKSLEDAGYLWNIDCNTAAERLVNMPPKTWLIRRSSPKNNESLMKNAELVTLSRRTFVNLPTSTLCPSKIKHPVSHTRYLHAIGVGWYPASFNIENATSFLRFVTENEMKMVPSYSSFIDLIDSYRRRNHLEYSQLLTKCDEKTSQ